MVETERKYNLKIFDDTLLTFKIKVDEFGRMTAYVDEVNCQKKHLLPFNLLPQPTGEKIISWLSNRTIPKNRRFVEQILSAAGLNQNDIIGIIDICKGLSVNDSYWLDDGTEKLSFSDINLFDNPLDETLALVAYTGYTSSQRHKIGLSSEWTTTGQFAKAWRRIDDILYLFKAGEEEFANFGLEPYSEYFAAQLAEAMNIDHVPYNLKMWKGKLASVCPLFNSKDVSFVPYWISSGQSSFPATLAAGYALSEDIYQKLRSMIIFDALICNTDRHAANYGVLRDNHTGEVIDMAPLFDHNLSLFARDMRMDFKHFNERANTFYNPAGSGLSFLEMSAMVKGEEQHKQLCNVIDFKFKNHPEYPISDDRLNALNNYIKVRTNELLELSPVSEIKLMKSMEKELAHLKDNVPMLLDKLPKITKADRGLEPESDAPAKNEGIER